MGRSDRDPNDLGLVDRHTHIFRAVPPTPGLRTIFPWFWVKQFRDL
jgi:hypothetical protein